MECRHKSVTLQTICRACLLALVSFATCARAQLNVGDNTAMRLNGYLGMGYFGNYADTGVSGHGLFGSGSGQLSGYYYNPNFLSFDVRPYYNRNQDNGSFGSVLRDTGVDANTNLFT